LLSFLFIKFNKKIAKNNPCYHNNNCLRQSLGINMSKVMQIIRVGALALTTATVLTACGGGGGSAAIPLTPTTQHL
jgi:hypothetical protein